ncbi:MAG: hypothetical protein FJ135_06090 [Deltaproteobacteria bacterium]|nr:hypothetical protein [Deltaproteobacteria bacterium]
MHYFKEMEKLAVSLEMKMVVIQVQPGETTKEAWARHLQDHPHDSNAMIKVFNQPENRGALRVS